MHAYTRATRTAANTNARHTHVTTWHDTDMNTNNAENTWSSTAQHAEHDTHAREHERDSTGTHTKQMRVHA